MNGRERYKTEADYRRALEQRLATAAHKSARGLVRERQLLVFERFLARAAAADLHVVVKGGMALELRTQRARMTRDIDLRAMGSPGAFEQALLALGTTDVGDFLGFVVEQHARPRIDALGMKYPGRRYRVQAWLAGKVYGDPFGVDVAFGEPMLGAPERLYGRCDLAFIGLEAPAFAVCSRTTHIAEKLHAYSVPRPTPNSRVRDLPDLAILAGLGPLAWQELRDAIEKTFAHRATHAVPPALAPAPERWRLPYRELAEANRLVWRELDEMHRAASAFVDPVLQEAHAAEIWNPTSWTWSG
jgi:hypothetical protein